MSELSIERAARRQPGRPSAAQQPGGRDALLDAAGRLFGRHGAAGVSLRRVAEEAGVTPAMVHYYFGGKEGLYDAMLERTFARVLERVRELTRFAPAASAGVTGTAPTGVAAASAAATSGVVTGTAANAAAATGTAGTRATSGASRARTAPEHLGDLLDVLVETFAAEPWLPILVVREVLAEGGRLRERFIRDYASHMAELLPNLMRREIEAGGLRADLEPDLAFVSLMGMTIMPFVARPVLERVLGLDYGDAFLRRFADHTQKLFVQGAGA